MTPPHARASSAGWVQPPGVDPAPFVLVQYRGPLPGSPPPRREHLPQWYRQHQYLPPQAQERALRSEPGFSRLPPGKQQRLIYRLRQLNAMSPAVRERTLERMEALERLSPEQRQRVRNAMQQITHMPQDRRRVMQQAFRDLSALTPGLRQELLNSPKYKQQFTHREREMLATLMSIQPYIPVPAPGHGMTYGKPAK